MRMFVKGSRFKVSYKFNKKNLVHLQLLHFYGDENLNCFRENFLVFKMLQINLASLIQNKIDGCLLLKLNEIENVPK